MATDASTLGTTPDLSDPAPSSAQLRAVLRSSLGWTSLALLGSVLLHIDRAPIWVTGVACALIAWRLLAERHPVRLPGKFSRATIALVLVVAVFIRFHTLNGLHAGTLLLLLMSAIKLLETRARRDQFIVVGGSLFLLLAACLERQDLLRIPLYVLQTWLCCGALAIVAYTHDGKPPGATSSIEHGRGFDSRAALLLAGRALLYSLPLAVVLFILFPRVQGAFWAVPRSEDAETGLSDTMSPGSISQLTSSYDVAFRVKFAGAVPPPRERYWRGPVLHSFDGFTWSRPPTTTYDAEQLEYLGRPYYYRISLEPSQQPWWFSLDTVAEIHAPKVSLAYDHSLIGSDPVTEFTTYEAVSYTATRTQQPLSNRARRIETTLPRGRNPRSIQLARELRSRAGSDGEFVAAVLEYLRTEGFVYSLEPPLLNKDAVDDFLFNSRSGFCGHYASAFVTLMRAANVPARVVTGYLGGEWNPIGGYLILRQSDAHAWAEVWLDGQGWTRVDPTTVVEPDRLTRGMLDLLPESGSREARLLHSSPTLSRLLARWDAANAWWNDHVVKFDYAAQLNLLRQLGIRSPDMQTLGWGFLGGLLLWLGWMAWRFGRAIPRTRPDRLGRAYGRLCRKLARAGLPARAAHEGPLAYADTLSAQRPDLPPEVRRLFTRYAELRFGAEAGSYDADVRDFERGVGALTL
jgi:transglutaminase-like putative cysteine protease